MAGLPDYRTYMRGLLKDALNKLSDAELNLHVQQAVEKYSKDRPRWVIDLVTRVVGQTRYNVPARWISEFSVLHPSEPIEVPIDKVPPDFMRIPDDVIVQQTGDDAYQFVFVGGEPTGNFRAKYSIMHAVTEIAETVRVKDRSAVMALATSYALRALADYYAQTSAPEIGTDVVDYRSKSREYSSLAKEQEAIYTRNVQGTKESLTAASAVSHESVRLTWGAQRLFHPSIWR